MYPLFLPAQTPVRRTASIFLKICISVLSLVLLGHLALAASTVKSMSNKVEKIEQVSGVENNWLLVHVRTGIYHTKGSTVPEENIHRDCSNDSAAAIRFDGPSPTIEQELMRQIAKTAQVGPFRIKFRILQGECAEIPELADTFPVATQVQVQQLKDN